MRTRRSLVGLVALAVVVCAPSPARAVDYADGLDDFAVHVDAPGFIACITYPTDRWDKLDCDGLNAEFEAAQRAALPSDAVLIGASVHRADGWGFRARATRVPRAPFVFRDDVGDRRMADALRTRLIDDARAAKLAVIPRTIETTWVTVAGDVHAMRTAYEAESDPPIAVVHYFVPGEHAVYQLEWLGAREHATELASIAERALASLRVRPAPRRAVVWGMAATIVVVGLLAVGGTIALFALLASTRKRTRTSAISWPGTRG